MYDSLTVTGSLVVDGVLSDWHCGSRITIGGDLTATGVFCAGDLHVGGDLTADVLYCAVLMPQTLATGTVRARLVLEEDPVNEADHPGIRAGIVTDLHVDVLTYLDEDDADTTQRLRALLVDEVIDPECFNAIFSNG